MAQKEQKNGRVRHYLLSFILFLLFMGSGLFVAFNTLPTSLPWHFYMLIFFFCISPFLLLAIYLMIQALVPIYRQEIPVKGIRQWVAVYIFALGFVLYWALFAFLFETFAPTIPEGYRKTTLPLIACLLTIIAIAKTRLRLRFKHLFEEDSK